VTETRSTETGASSPLTLGGADARRLESNLKLAVARARRSGVPTLAGVTVELAGDCSPSELVCASRRAGEPWFVFEQPDRGGAALAGLGAAATLTASGPGRFRELTRRWRELSASAAADPPVGPAGSGLVAFGGFAFAPEGGVATHWRGFEPASLTVPEVALARGGGEGGASVRLALAALASADDLPEELLERLVLGTRELTSRDLPLLDPAPAGSFHVGSAMPPEHYEQAVARAVELAGAGRLEKIVLAR
jgi:isochorismate synthase EntC